MSGLQDVIDARDETCPFCPSSERREAVPRAVALGAVRTWWSVDVGYNHVVSGWVFEPLSPVTPGHVLVVPRTHSDSLVDVVPSVTGAVMKVAADYAFRLHQDVNIITSHGQAATQTVQHGHAHVVPRTPGDGLPLPWTPQQEGTHRASV